MLNFSEFQEYIRMNFSEVFEKEKINVELSLNSVTKNNGTEFHALTIRTEGSNIAANIYLDDSYERYVEGEDLDYLVKQIYRSVGESLVIPYEFTTVGKDLMDFDYAKDKIIMVAVNAEKNKELLADVPYQLKEDLALIYKVKLETNNEEMATVTIHNNLLKTWGATKEEIHELAMKNTRELLPVTIQSMDEVMRELFARDGMPKEVAEAIFTEMPADQQMYVISNKPKVNGAASIFYEDELAKLAEKLGTDLYILPSSVHECIAISEKMSTPDLLVQMVQEVNGTQVAADEQLSDHVYRFDAKERKLSLADTTVENLEIKVVEKEADYEVTHGLNENVRPHRHR